MDPIDTKVETSDLLDEAGSVIEPTSPLHALQLEIAAMPAVDQQKIEAVIKKLREGSLGILGNEADRLASELRVAARIMEESLSKKDD